MFFYDGHKINIKVLENVVKQVDRLIEAFKMFNGVKFVSSSLFIAFDGAHPEHFELKLIDFDKYEHDLNLEYDTNISVGL